MLIIRWPAPRAAGDRARGQAFGIADMLRKLLARQHQDHLLEVGAELSS